MKKWSLYLLTLTLISAVLSACNSTADQPNLAPRTELTLVATDIVYDANRLEVVAGQPVKLALKNDGVLEHDFSITEIPHTGEAEAHEEVAGHDMSGMSVDPEVHVAAPAGGSNSIEFTPSEPGEYEYWCTVSGHKEAGMVGTLIVTAP
jgi:uncharacterized cupredoxin-like copper-binding protein